MKNFLEYVPLIFFLGSYYLYDLMVATATIIVISIITLALQFFIEKKLSWTTIITTILVVIFGGLTLILQDEKFIKMKLTILELLFAGVLGGGLIFKKNFLKMIIGEKIKLPIKIWNKFTINFIMFFIFIAILNEIIWRTQTTEVWIWFKVVGFLVLTFIFLLANIPLLSKNIINEKEK